MGLRFFTVLKSLSGSFREKVFLGMGLVFLLENFQGCEENFSCFGSVSAWKVQNSDKKDNARGMKYRSLV